MHSARRARRAITRRTPGLAAGAVALLAAATLLSGCAFDSTGGAPGSTPAELAEQIGAADGAGDGADEASIAQNALDVLASIDIAPRTEWDGYFDRVGSFGDGWGDPDGNGCDARNDALQEALTDVELLDDGCRVASGLFEDPYSGETIDFERGPRTSEEVQIDHVVALYSAWRTGAQDLTYDERLLLANDPLNLQPTAGWANDDKQAADASRWLPPNEDYHCTYVARQIAVKATYDLWVTQAEHDTMVDILNGCV